MSKILEIGLHELTISKIGCALGIAFFQNINSFTIYYSLPQINEIYISLFETSAVLL